MIFKILQDADCRPEAFFWHRTTCARDVERARAWLGGDRPLPAELWELLLRTGGGDYFDSETLLSIEPERASLPDYADGFQETNTSLWESGLPRHLVAFAIGMSVSVVDSRSGEFVELDNASLAEVARYPSLDAWYVGAKRSIFAERYGLPAK